MAVLFMRFLTGDDAAFSTKFISRFQRRIASMTVLKQFGSAAAAKPIVGFVSRMAAWAIHHGILMKYAGDCVRAVQQKNDPQLTAALSLITDWT